LFFLTANLPFSVSQNREKGLNDKIQQTYNQQHTTKKTQYFSPPSWIGFGLSSA